MLSLELSTIQSKDADRAMIAKAMASYTGEIEQVGSIMQGGAWSFGNSMTLPGSSTNTRAENREAALVRRISELAEKGAGVTSIAKTMGIDTRKVRNLARDHGVFIPMVVFVEAAMNRALERIKHELNTVERIKALAACKLPAREIRKRVDMRPAEFEQLAARHGIALTFRNGD